MAQVVNRSTDKFNGDADVRVVVLHHTAGSEQSDIATLWGAAEVSIHAYITKRGTIYLGVPLGKRAWHAGSPSYWNGLTDINSYSIGVELENLGDGSDPYPAAQLSALDYFLAAIVRPLYGLLPITRHRDILAGKIDPSDNFPWDSYRRGIAQVMGRAAIPGDKLQEDDDMAQPVPMNADKTKWQGYMNWAAFPEACFLIAVSSGDAPGVPEPAGHIADVNIYLADKGRWVLADTKKIGDAGPTLIWRRAGYNGQVVVDSSGPSIVVQSA